MKINILTFQFAKNYGAILQAHALSSYIKNDLHEECEIIQYWPERSDASWNMYYRGFEPKVILRNIFVFFNIKFGTLSSALTILHTSSILQSQ